MSINSDRSKSGTAVFVRLCARPIPRIVRMMLVAQDLGMTPRFVGAFRERGLKKHDKWDDWDVERIGPFFPLVNGKRPFLYLWSVFRFGWSLFFHLVKMKPSVVHVSDFELFMPARIYTFFTRTPLLYNIHDNLSQRYRCPKWVAWILNTLEGIASICATVTLVPEEFRRTALPSWAGANVHVVRNSPVDPGYSPPSDGADVVTLFFGGWIDSGRGIRQLAELVEHQPGLCLRVAGEGDADLLTEVRAKPNVESLGFLSHKAVIRETVSCDFVSALYDPSRPINRFAASNKIAEALAVGRPLIINGELKIVELLKPYRCVVVVEYGDLAGLGKRLQELRDSEEYLKMCARARDAYEDHYAWEAIYASSVSTFNAAGV